MSEESAPNKEFKLFEQLAQRILPQPSVDDDSLNFEQKRVLALEDTRKKFAVSFMRAYFIVITICILAVTAIYVVEYISNPSTANSSNVKDVMLSLIASISGTLGFVVGFYFKSSSN